MRVDTTTRMANRSPHVGGQNTNYRFTVIADGILRYEWAPDGIFEDRPSSFAINRIPAVIPEFTVTETASRLDITTSRFHLTYNKQEFGSHGLFALVFEHTRSLWRYGEHKPWENLDGTARTLDEADGRVDMGTGIMSQKGYATIDDSESMLFTDDGFVASRRPGPGRIDGYLFAYGHDYRAGIKAFYALSGSTPLLPRWTLGNWWSRYYAYSAESYLALVDKFHENNIPLSVGVLDMDWHLVEDDPKVIAAKQTGWTGYTWNKKLFPDPPAFLAGLHKRGLKTALNDHPADGIHSYEDIYQTLATAVGHDTSSNAPIEFDVSNRFFFKEYFNTLLTSLDRDGVDFWWIDWQQGRHSLMANVDPLWMLNHFGFKHNKETYPDRHPLVFSRYAGPGSHRYPVGFSGDTVVSWNSLGFQPEFTATASNIGYGWWSHDLGGHMFGTKDEELTMRWVQLGVFSPIFRLHSTKSRWMAKEPWNLTQPYGDVVGEFMRLRHRLIPYLHTMNARAAVEGLPLVQPVYWEWPERDEAYRYKNSYLFGSEMFVVPIVTAENSSLRLAKTRAWLPPGRWVDFFTGMAYEGDRELWLTRPKEQYPVFIREGGIVPLDGELKLRNGGANPDILEIVIVPGQDGSFEMLEEDQAASQGGLADEVDWIKTKISYKQSGGALRIVNHDPRAQEREWRLLLLGVFKEDLGTPAVRIDGKVVSDTAELQEASNGISIKFGNGKLSIGTTVVELGTSLHAMSSNNRGLAQIEKIVNDAQIEYNLKEKVWDAVSRMNGPNGRSTSQVFNQLAAIDMGEDLRIAVSEHLLG